MEQNNMEILKKYIGHITIRIESVNEKTRWVITSITNGTGSCARVYNSPEEVREAFKNDRWCIFDYYSPDELIKIMYEH